MVVWDEALTCSGKRRLDAWGSMQLFLHSNQNMLEIMSPYSETRKIPLDVDWQVDAILYATTRLAYALIGDCRP